MKRTVAWIGSGACLIGLGLFLSSALGGQRLTSTRPSPPEEHTDQVCTNATLIGTYGFLRTGTTLQGPLGAVGLSVNDGKGFFTATQTISRNGAFNQASFDGTYEVNADCSGRLLTPDKQRVIGYFVLVDGGNEIFLLSATSGNSVTGISKRIARRTER